MIIIFLIVIILILFYFLVKNKDNFVVKNYIKGNKLNDEIKYDNTNIFLGKNIQQDYITFDTQFYLKVNVPNLNVDNELLGEADSSNCPISISNWKLPNGKCCDTKFADINSCVKDYKINVGDSYYLNNGFMCPKQISNSECFKSASNIVSEALLYKGFPKKTNCLQTGCLPKDKNDDYCCSNQSITNLRCHKAFRQKTCVPTYDYKKEDGQCLKKNETRHNCKSGKDSRDVDCESHDNHPFKCGNNKDKILTSIDLDLGNESLKHNINDNTNSGLWKFFDIERNSDNLVYYGHELLLKNISNIISYLCVCDSTIDIIKKCGNKVDIYCYNDIKDAKLFGKWIIIPKYFNKFSYIRNEKTRDILRDINKESVEFDFYEDHDLDYYDFETLKSKKIPIEINEKFLIVNTNKINGNYVYLNFCADNDTNLEQNCNENIYKKVIGSIPTTTQLANFNKTDLYIYNWSIEATKYDINVYDTLFVDGSITLGDDDDNIKITSDTLRYIKSIPYHFDKEICVKDENNMANCINKEHIEMLNGSRPINIKSVTPAKPFILYSGANYTGRELRIGFDYENTHDLPYIGDINEWLNPNDHGKWMSLKIEGPYSAIIFNKPNYGYDKSNLYIEQNKMTLYEAKDKKYPPIQTLSTTLSEKQALCYLENNPGLIDAFKPKSELGSGEDDRIEKAKAHWINYGLWEIGTDKEKKSPFMCDYDNNNTLSNNTLNNNIIQNVVKSPGITNIRDLGKTWNDGIRSIIFRYKNKDGEYKEISSNTKSFELKCLEKKRFLNQPYKQNNNRGNKWRTDKSGGKVKNQDSGTLVDSVIYTANLCKNGYDDQNFYLTNDNDSKFVDSKIYDIESDHIHFHRHSYDINHEQLEDINDI